MVVRLRLNRVVDEPRRKRSTVNVDGLWVGGLDRLAGLRVSLGKETVGQPRNLRLESLPKLPHGDRVAYLVHRRRLRRERRRRQNNGDTDANFRFDQPPESWHHLVFRKVP